MSINTFAPLLEHRTAIITLNSGYKFRADITLRNDGEPRWHGDFEQQLVREWNKAQPHAVHKAIKIHLLRN